MSIRIRRDTAANFTANNPTLAAGEEAIESDTGAMKIGDGSTAWTTLKYQNVEVGSYTPTLGVIVIGSGGSPTNTAIYTWVGPGVTGAHGILSVQGTIKFGTSGQTFPSAATTIALPTGFAFDDAFGGTATAQCLGEAMFEDASPAAYYAGAIVYATTTVVGIAALASAASYLTPSAVTTTIPFTWASNDLIVYKYTIRAERI